MPRKGENIRKRQDGRWEARYKKGRKPDGSIQYGFVYASKYLDVKEKRDQAIQNLTQGATKQEHLVLSCSFDMLFDEWLQNVRPKVKASSYFYYETIVEHHLRPYWSDLPLGCTNRLSIQTFMESKRKENLSSSYLSSIAVILQSILKFAFAQKYIEDFSISGLLPKSAPRKTAVYNFQEWKVLEQYLEKQSDSFSFGLLICMCTGLRIGELSGLKWSDFDFYNGSILIQRTVYRIKNSNYDGSARSPKTIVCIGSPKTPSSVRTIPLPLSLLRKAPAYCADEDSFVLTGTKSCMEPRTIQKRYRKLLAQCDLRYLNFHSLRHSFATLGVQKGFDYKTLSEILGHASVNTTLSIYVHSDIEQKRQCIESLLI